MSFFQVFSHRKQWRKLAGLIHNQHGHRICYGYVVSDIVSIKRVIRGWEDEYVPLCPWFLSYFVPSDDPTIKGGHRCGTNSIEDCLKFIQREGVPKEIPEHHVFDCKKRPLSADLKFKSKSVITIETLEEALQELKPQAIGASLIVFPDLFSRGKVKFIFILSFDNIYMFYINILLFIIFYRAILKNRLNYSFMAKLAHTL